jgi:membrane dipeptidase
MIADCADIMGVDNIGIGSDLCQDHPDSVVEWMRVGRWTKKIDYGEGSATNAGFPDMPPWFNDNRDFSNIEQGLLDVGFNAQDTAKIMGNNWLRFFDENFGPK